MADLESPVADRVQHLETVIRPALAAGQVGRVFDRVSTVEWWARRLTGVVFLGVGAWFTLAYSLRLF